MKKKVILTCALTGSAPLSPSYPKELSFPVTPAQIARDAIDCAKSGASIVHVHVRNPETGGASRDPKLFLEVTDRIRQSGIDIVLNLTCGMGALLLPDPEDESRALPESDVIPVHARVQHARECLPEICSLDVTTANQVEGNLDYVYLNTPRTLRGMAKVFRQIGVKPELEVFQAGDILLANQMVADGLVDGPPLYQFVLGVRWGAPATPETMIYMRSLIPPEAIWSGFGISRMQMPMAAQAVLLGGNVRVGLEDNLYLARGVFATNVQLVERATSIIENLGCEVASPRDARQILGLRSPVESFTSLAAKIQNQSEVRL